MLLSANTGQQKDDCVNRDAVFVISRLWGNHMLATWKPKFPFYRVGYIIFCKGEEGAW